MEIEIEIGCRCVIEKEGDREKKTDMKKEAVKTRPMARVKTESVGYHESGTGLVIGFGAFNIKSKTQNQKIEIEKTATK